MSNIDSVEQHVIQSGKYSELGDLFREKLRAAGWYDKVTAYAAREISAADSISMKSPEMTTVFQQSIKMMPDDIKLEMRKIIDSVVDELVEKN